MCGKAQPHDKKQAQLTRGQQQRKRKQQLDGFYCEAHVEVHWIVTFE
jgi:hypothetical protein